VNTQSALHPWLRGIACCAWVVLSSLSVARAAHAEPPKGESTHSRHSHTGKANSALEPAPPVARRLWGDLFCMCGECEHVTLADCGCDNAAQVRKRIVEQVERMGLGSPERDEAAYSSVLEGYVATHGAQAEVAYVKRHAWLDPLLTLGAGISAVVLVIVIVERVRSMRRSGESAASPAKQRPKGHPRFGRKLRK
jgi:hypothetical protein